MDAGEHLTNEERRELVRNYQRRRLAHLECADGYLAIARRLLRPELREVPGAVRVLTKSALAYQGAGLTRRGKAVWRFCRMVHAASVREAMR